MVRYTVIWILWQYFKNELKRGIRTGKMQAQALEQVTWVHKCSLTSSVCFQQLGLSFVFFCFGFSEQIVFPFSSPSRTWPSIDVEGESQSHSVDRAPLMACRTDLLSLSSPGQQWQVNTGFILVALLYFRGQLSLLHTSSPSSQGAVTQPSKYQNMLWFETWCRVPSPRRTVVCFQI